MCTYVLSARKARSLPTAPTLKEKVTSVALGAIDVIQEANETASLKTSGTVGERLDRLISELGINLTTVSAGAGLGAARNGNVALLPAGTAARRSAAIPSHEAKRTAWAAAHPKEAAASKATGVVLM